MLVSDSEYQILHKECRDFIDRRCIVRNRTMPGKLPNTVNTWMFYMRNGLFNPDFIQAISTLFIHKVEKEIGHFNFQLAGVETGATPMLSAFPLISKVYGLNLSAFAIRKEQKTYGLKNWTEGVVIDKLPCMLIDDLCNSGMSLAHGHKILTDAKLPVFPYAFTIINKVNKNVHEYSRRQTDMYLPKDIKILYLFDLDDFGLDNPSH